MWHTLQFIDITSVQNATTGAWEEVQNVLLTIHCAARQVTGNRLRESNGQLALDNTMEFEFRMPVNFPINVNTFMVYNNRFYRPVNIQVIDERNFKYLVTAESQDSATIEM